MSGSRNWRERRIPHGQQIVLASGQRLRPDFIVLATGSSYPFPAKSDALSTVDAIGRYRAAHASLSQANRVMLLGAGAVGLELAVGSPP